MAQSSRIHRFRKRYLALIVGLNMLPAAHAMQELSDHSLSDTTGEGVALVLDNFKMVMQGANDISKHSTYNQLNYVNPSQADTGFIRIIPTGENYGILGERTYDKIYRETYESALYIDKSTNYANNYNTVYTRMETNFYNNNHPAIVTKHDTQANKDKFSQELIDYYYNTDLMKAYYEQRYDDYYNGAGTGLDYKLINDGTTAYSLTPLRPNRSKEYAKLNTLEMIQILYGNRSNETVPSTQWTTAVGTRSNVIGSIVTARINQLIAEEYAQKLNAIRATLKTDAEKEVIDKMIASATQAAQDAAMNFSVDDLRTKADIFIYGLALSKSDDSLSSRYSNQGFSWGTTDNPWLFRAGSEKVKQFKDKEEEVGYIALEAPLATVAKSDADNNIKLGFWTDIFSRKLNSSNQVDPITGAPVWKDATGKDISGLDKDYRLRLQVVANGLSLNGSQVRLFQTLSSADSNYNQTLGMASIIRLNTNDEPSNIGYVDTNLYARFDKINTYTDEQITGFRTKTDTELKALGLDRDLISVQTVALAKQHKANPNFYSQRNASLNAKGIRISTAETTNDSDAANTPATPALLYGAKAPIFHDVEGLYLYSPNINLVLGNMYQPFVVGSKGNNIILEVTRIPNIPSIYTKIYQNYADIIDTKDRSLFEGSTCNVSYCGTAIKAHGSDAVANYQGRNATHSSISIGTTEIISNNMLKAKTGADATGAVFKSINGTSKNLGSAVIDGVLIQHLKITTTGL